MNLFGKKKNNPPVPNVLETINKIREVVGLLEKREEYLDKQISSLTKQVIENGKTNKRKALFLLKKRKLLETESEKLCGQKFNLEIQLATLSQSIINLETFKMIEAGNKTLSEMSKVFNPDKVSDMMGDISENIQDVEEVTNIMAQPINVEMDDAELLKELELEVEHDLKNELDAKLQKDPVIDLPKVPIKKRDTRLEKEDRDLEELKALMS